MEKEVRQDLQNRCYMLKTIAEAYKNNPQTFGAKEDGVEELEYDGRLLTIYFSKENGEEERPLLSVRLEVKGGNETIKVRIAGSVFTAVNKSLDEQLDETAKVLCEVTENISTDENIKLRWDWLGD